MPCPWRCAAIRGRGRFTAAVRPTRPACTGFARTRGVARRSLGAAERWMYVGGSDREFADPRLNEGLLRRLARASGGRYVRAGDAATLPPALQAAAPHRPRPSGATSGTSRGRSRCSSRCCRPSGCCAGAGGCGEPRAVAWRRPRRRSSSCSAAPASASRAVRADRDRRVGRRRVRRRSTGVADVAPATLTRRSAIRRTTSMCSPRTRRRDRRRRRAANVSARSPTCAGRAAKDDLAAGAAHRPRHGARRRRGQVQPRGPGPDRDEWAELLKPIAGPPGLRQHDERELSVPAHARRPRNASSHRDRFRRAAVRDRVPRVLRPRASRPTRPTSTRTAGCRCGRRSSTPAPA